MWYVHFYYFCSWIASKEVITGIAHETGWIKAPRQGQNQVRLTGCGAGNVRSGALGHSVIWADLSHSR
jgi:hypothetical protein